MNYKAICRCLLFLTLITAALHVSGQKASVVPVQMRCEYLENPVGLDESRPRLSWTLAATDTASFRQKQSAYRILVSGSSANLKVNKGDVWDSGWQKSSQMQLINYNGKKLLSDRTYFWKLAVKDEKGQISRWSKPVYWTTGLFSQAEWKAKWIGTAQIFDPGQPDCNINDPWLRKSFTIKTKPARATFFVASVGYHEVYVNGKKIGNDVLSPSVTDHSKRARYVAYNIAPELKPGKNVIAIWLGTSWSVFGPYIVKDRPNTPIVIGQGAINGNIIATDETWKTHDSPNKLLGVWDFGKMGGELWDARKEMDNWNTIDCDEKSWTQAVVYKPKLILSAQQVEPNRLFEEIKAVSIESRSDGSYRVDMGVNFAGWTSVNVSGKPGDRIDFLYSERAQDDMTLSLHSAFIIGEEGKGTFKNRFNYSSGRWITIKGLKTKPALSDIKGWMVRTNFSTATKFESSDPLQNWIYNTVNWTFENLSLGGYVVDCPQRERLGYGGDAHATCETGMLNYELGAFYTKWMEDWRDVKGTETIVGNMHDQKWARNGIMSGRPLHPGILPHTAPTYMGGGGPAWGGINVILPWLFYQQYGDKTILEKNFPMMIDWLEFLDTHTQDNMLVRYGGDWDFLGDWLWPGATAEGMNNNKPQTVFLNNAYRVFNLRTAVKIAKIIGKSDAAEKWQRQAELSSAALHAKYYNAEDFSYSDKSMGNLAAALLGDIMPENLKSTVMQRLEKEILDVRKGHIHVGITGGAMLFKMLRDAGRDDLIYSMTSQTTYPSWGYMKENDATTIWEMWEKDLPGHSLLHSSYLYPGAWYIDGLAGIKTDLDYPGYHRFILRPPLLSAAQMKWAKADMNSPAGRIKAMWKREMGKLSYSISVPPNSLATLQIPIAEAGAMSGDTKYVKAKGVKDGFKLFELSAGNYRLSFDQAEMP